MNEPASLDDEGHLTYADGGSTLPGLCHCARNEAHYADEEGPKRSGFTAPTDAVSVLTKNTPEGS